MNPQFHREINIKEKYKRYLVFLKWFTALMILGFSIFYWFTREKIDITSLTGFIACGLITLSLVWIVVYRTYRIGGSHVWEVKDGRVIHTSPSPMLGTSFNVAIANICKIKVGGDESAQIILNNGDIVKFLLNDMESEEFYKYIKTIQQMA